MCAAGEAVDCEAAAVAKGDAEVQARDEAAQHHAVDHREDVGICIPDVMHIHRRTHTRSHMAHTWMRHIHRSRTGT
eukprot:13629-Eustigmatos_ZCMA.PRE.1